jgi:hypothetical protein
MTSQQKKSTTIVSETFKEHSNIVALQPQQSLYISNSYERLIHGQLQLLPCPSCGHTQACKTNSPVSSNMLHSILPQPNH